MGYRTTGEEQTRIGTITIEDRRAFKLMALIGYEDIIKDIKSGKILLLYIS